MDTRSGFLTNIPKEVEAIPKEHREELTREEYEALLKHKEEERVAELERMRAFRPESKRQGSEFEKLRREIEKKHREFDKRKKAKKRADKSRTRNRK